MTTLVDDTQHHDHPPGPGHLSDGVRRLCQRALADSTYTLTAFPIALAASAITTVLLSLGAGLLIVLSGVFVLGAAVRSARWFAGVERRRLSSLLARRSPTPEYRRANPEDGFWSRSVVPLVDPQSWRDVSWSLLGAVTATAAAVVTITWTAAAIDGLTYWFWQSFVSQGNGSLSLASVLGLAEGRLEESVVNFVLGLVALLSLPFVIRAAAAVHATAARVLLDGSTA
jgi:hypothetical protein